MQRTPLNYPLDCALKVNGKRLGHVWADSTIFRKSTHDSLRYNDSEWKRDTVQDWILEWENNWAANPSVNIKTRTCPERRDFWYDVIKDYRRLNSGLTDETLGLHADIPPAFGGFCTHCLRIDLINWAFLPGRQHINKINPDDTVGQFRCICAYPPALTKAGRETHNLAQSKSEIIRVELNTLSGIRTVSIILRILWTNFAAS